MEYLFLCILMITVQGGPIEDSIYELGIKYTGIASILKKEQETTNQLKLEISELKKELVNSRERASTYDSIGELIEKLAVVGSNLDVLKSGQEIEKVERHGILADLGQIKQWTSGLIAETERGWSNAIANFSTGNRDKQLDYEKFKTQASDEWDQWRDKAQETLSGIEAGFEKAKTDFQRQQTQFESRVDGLEKSVNCFKDCETGWTKNGCSCYSLPNKFPLQYDVAIHMCAGSLARLIQPGEITADMFIGTSFMWTGVSKDSDQLWRYPNGTEAKGFKTLRTLTKAKKQCGIVHKNMKGKILFLSASCNVPYRFICAKSSG